MTTTVIVMIVVTNIFLLTILLGFDQEMELVLSALALLDCGTGFAAWIWKFTRNT